MMQAAKLTLKRLCISQLKAAERKLFSLRCTLLRILNERSDGDGKNYLHPELHRVWVLLAVTSLCNYFKGNVGENGTNWSSSDSHHYLVPLYLSFLKVKVKLHLEWLGRPKALVFRPQNVSIYKKKPKPNKLTKIPSIDDWENLNH